MSCKKRKAKEIKFEGDMKHHAAEALSSGRDSRLKLQLKKSKQEQLKALNGKLNAMKLNGLVLSK